jgi:hypothetical protein
MKRVLAAVLICVSPLAWAQSPARPPAAAPQPSRPAAEADPLAFLGWLRGLAGSCWQGTDEGGVPTDRQCYELQYGHFLKGSIVVGSPGAATGAFRGDSLFHNVGRSGTVGVVMWGSNGLVSIGQAHMEGSVLRFNQPKAEGRPAIRVSWTPQGTEGFRVSREQQEGNAWKELNAISYRRAAK